MPPCPRGAAAAPSLRPSLWSRVLGSVGRLQSWLSHWGRHPPSLDKVDAGLHLTCPTCHLCPSVDTGSVNHPLSMPDYVSPSLMLSFWNLPFNNSIPILSPELSLGNLQSLSLKLLLFLTHPEASAE